MNSITFYPKRWRLQLAPVIYDVAHIRVFEVALDLLLLQHTTINLTNFDSGAFKFKLPKFVSSLN